MDWNDIKVLIEVAKAGSFTGASTALGISQPTITRRVAAVEAAAGARLFRRSTTGVELTEVGRDLMHRAAKVEASIQDFEASLRDAGHRLQRRVLVQASEGVSTYLLMPLITGQSYGPLGGLARRIGIELPAIELMPPHSPERSDIRIVWTAPEDLPHGHASDRAKKLASIRFVPYGSDAYAATARAPINRFEDIGRHAVITLRDYEWFRTGESLLAWNWAVDAAGAAAVTTGWSSSVVQLTGSGGGIGLLPTYAPMYSNLLKPLDVACPSMQASLWILSGEDDLKDPTIRKCYDAISKAFGNFKW